MESGRKFVEAILHHIRTETLLTNSAKSRLVMSLKEIFENLREYYKSTSTKKEKFWCEFHRKRLHTLPDIWKRFCKGLEIPYSQLVARLIQRLQHMLLSDLQLATVKL